MLFIFDNQCSHRIAKGLNILEEGNKMSPYQCEVRHISELIPENSPDDEVIKEVGRQGGIVITYDRDFKEIRQHYELYEQYQMGVIFFRSTKKVLRYWDIVLSFINKWEELKKKVNDTPKPFALEVTLHGISHLKF